MVIILGLFLSTYIVFQWEFSLLSMTAMGALAILATGVATVLHCGLINPDEPAQMAEIRAQSHRYTGPLRGKENPSIRPSFITALTAAIHRSLYEKSLHE
jgi:hypothetical protein